MKNQVNISGKINNNMVMINSNINIVKLIDYDIIIKEVVCPNKLKCFSVISLRITNNSLTSIINAYLLNQLPSVVEILKNSVEINNKKSKYKFLNGLLELKLPEIEKGKTITINFIIRRIEYYNCTFDNYSILKIDNKIFTSNVVTIYNGFQGEQNGPNCCL